MAETEALLVTNMIFTFSTPDLNTLLLIGGVIFVVSVLLLYGFFKRRGKLVAPIQLGKPQGHRDRTVESLERIASALEVFGGGGEPSGLSGRLLKLADQYEGMAKMGLTSGVPPMDVAKSIRNAVQDVK